MKAEVGKAPWPPRAPRPDESLPRVDWHVYCHLELVRGESRETAAFLERYIKLRGRRPVIY